MQDFFYFLYCLILRLLLGPFVRRHVFAVEHVPARGGCILAPNHISHFDPPLLGITLSRTIDWMAMRELFATSWSRRLFQLIGTFPVDREGLDRAAVKTALARLQSGRALGLFPEGGLRTGAESVLEGAPLKPGAAALAQMAGVPIIPCVIIGSDVLYDRRRWRPWRRVEVWILFGEPWTVGDGGAAGRREARQQAENRLGNELRRLYAELQHLGRIPSECLPQTPQRRKGRQ